jgi:site-specific DNA-methyltransferase (adenine-specific)
LNIDACRVEYRDEKDRASAHPGRCTSKQHGIAAVPDAGSNSERVEFAYKQKGRWPANVLLDEVVADELDAQTGIGASRFFYVAKASRAEREAGCESLPTIRRTDGRAEEHDTPHLRTTQRRNFHPCVKPIALMRQLCRLVTPANGVVLDAFAGSGTTGCAAMLENLRFFGIEKNAEYADIAKARIGYWASLPAEAAA